jgi:hypothetical protein
MYKDTTHPIWNMGFGAIRNGTYYMFSANHKATDWRFWLDNDFLTKEGYELNIEDKIIPLSKENKNIKKISKKVAKNESNDKKVGIVRTEASLRRNLAIDTLNKKK